MKSYEDAVGLATQIAYEYPEYTCEHLYEFLQTYDPGTEPCDIDELGILCDSAKTRRDEGWDYSTTLENLREHRVKMPW